MKNFKHIALSGVAVLLTALSFTSCTDGNDWEVDSSHNRLFSPTKTSVSPQATEAKVTWTGTPGTEYYVIEVSKEPLTDDVKMGESEGSIVYGEDKSINQSPYEMTGLDSSSEYYLRIKSLSSAKPESKWSYPEEKSFKTKSEQIMESVGPADKTATTVNLRWTPNAVVTHIELLKGTDVVKTIALLSGDVLAQGAITIEGLDALTNYTANIYNNDVKRGYVSFQTYPQVPEADKIVYMEATDALNQALFDALAAEGFATVTFAMPANAVYKTAEKITIPSGMSVTFFGLPGANKPVIAAQAFGLSASHNFVKFDNIELSATGINDAGAAKTNDYLFNQSAATSVEIIEFNNCIVGEFNNTPIRLQGGDVKVINNFNVINSIVYGAPTRTYSLVHVDASSGKGVINNVKFENSTVKNTGKCFLYSKTTNMESITIRNCTFYNAPNASDYFIDFNDTKTGASNGLIIENTLFSTIQGGTATKGIRSKADMPMTVTNSYSTTDWVTTNSIPNITLYENSAANLFTDPAKNDFTIKDRSFPGKTSCGDPRWYMPE